MSRRRAIPSPFKIWKGNSKMFSSPLAGELLEREGSLAQMAARLRLVQAGQGQILLLFGEAGVGKSTLAHEFTLRNASHCDVLWGSCDSLITSRPLGAFDEIFATLGLKHSARNQDQTSTSLLFPTLLTKIAGNGGRPHLLVIEDLQWADSLSLDLLRYISRRVSRLGLMLILTIRTHDLNHGLSLRNLVADLPFRDTARIELLPLSRVAIGQLAAPNVEWGDALFDMSGGNPFYAKAVLEASIARRALISTNDVPQVVRDVVLGRLTNLSIAARLSCEFLSVLPGLISTVFLETVRDCAEKIDGTLLCAPASIEECERWGLLKTGDAGAHFTHDIVRATIEQSVPPLFSRQCHVIALRVQESIPQVSKEVLLFHARHAKAGQNIASYLYEAALEASASGAHRLAVNLFESLLDQLGALTGHQQARVLSGWAFAWSFSNFPNRRCIDMLKRAGELFRSLGEITSAGSVLVRQSTIHMFMGNPKDATKCAQAAVDLLESLPPEAALAMAYSQMAHCCMVRSDLQGTSTWAKKALSCNKSRGSVAVEAHALINLGAAQLRVGETSGQGRIEEGLLLALKHGFTEPALLAYLNLAECMLLECRHKSALDILVSGTALANDTGLLRNYFAGLGALVQLQQGKLASVELETAQLLEASTDPSGRDVLNWALYLAHGQARSRLSGRPASEQILRQVFEQSLTLGLPRFFLPPGLALVECYWIDSSLDEARAILLQCWSHRGQDDSPWHISALQVWAKRLGAVLEGGATQSVDGAATQRVEEATTQRVEGATTQGGEAPCTSSTAEPYALELQGAHASAASVWLTLGVPFEAALCLLHGKPEHFAQALSIFKGLGAQAAVNAAKRIAVAKGLELSQRGPYRSARTHPQGLTAKETHVLEYLKEGFSNADIADRLKRSERTVEHHVAAILKKLRIKNRTDVVLTFAARSA